MGRGAVSESEQEGEDPMKVLSLMEPWATLIRAGQKRVKKWKGRMKTGGGFVLIYRRR